MTRPRPAADHPWRHDKRRAIQPQAARVVQPGEVVDGRRYLGKEAWQRIKFGIDGQAVDAENGA